MHTAGYGEELRAAAEAARHHRQDRPPERDAEQRPPLSNRVGGM
jgi:hypothetical protein